MDEFYYCAENMEECSVCSEPTARAVANEERCWIPFCSEHAEEQKRKTPEAKVLIYRPRSLA